MKIRTCYFCGSSIYPGHGLMFIRNDATEYPLCSSKCRTHFQKRHSPSKSKWTKASRIMRGKELVDRKLESLRARKDVPIKYDRNLMIQTVQAIPRINNIELRRKTLLNERKKLEHYRKHEESLLNFLEKRGVEVSEEILASKDRHTNFEFMNIDEQQVLPIKHRALREI